MSQTPQEEGELRTRALEAQARLRDRLRRLAAATDEVFADALEAVRASLDEYDALLTDDRRRSLGWPEDARERVARARVELKHLEAGDALRTEVVGLLRLVMPRFEEEGEEG